VKFTDLANGDTYLICTRPLTDSTGALQFLTSCINGSDTTTNTWDPKDSKTTAAINLIKPSFDDTITMVGGNMLDIRNEKGVYNVATNNFSIAIDDGANGSYLVTDSFAVKPAQSIIVVYNYPVSVSGGITVSYLKTLDLSTTTGYGDTFLVTTATGGIDATGTVVTISNTASWAINQAYTVNSSVTAVINGGTQNSTFGNAFYVVNDDATSGLLKNTAANTNATLGVIADNYNGFTGTLTSNTIYVNFPEYVYGTYRVISKQTNSSVNVIIADADNNLPSGLITRGTNSNSTDNTANAHWGTADSVVYRVPIDNPNVAGFYTSVDNVSSNTASLSNITIHFDVRDLEGNDFSKTVTLPIQ
jgi:hypothetical protein